MLSDFRILDLADVLSNLWLVGLLFGNRVLNDKIGFLLSDELGVEFASLELDFFVAERNLLVELTLSVFLWRNRHKFAGFFHEDNLFAVVKELSVGNILETGWLAGETDLVRVWPHRVWSIDLSLDDIFSDVSLFFEPIEIQGRWLIFGVSLELRAHWLSNHIVAFVVYTCFFVSQG